MLLQPNSLAISQRQQPVVVHNRVHVLDPQCVHVAVKHNVLPLVLICWFVDLTEYAGQQTVSPVPCDGIQCTVELYHCACLGIHHVQLCGDPQAEGDNRLRTLVRE